MNDLARKSPPLINPVQTMSTENIKKKSFLWSKVRLVRGADNLTAICEPTV
jgi:hypothetical protein